MRWDCARLRALRTWPGRRRFHHQARTSAKASVRRRLNMNASASRADDTMPKGTIQTSERKE